MCFPFHADCLKLLAQAVTYLRHGKCALNPDLSVLNKDVLYASMSKKSEEYLQALKLDYGELADSASEQYWGCQPGQEVCFSAPSSLSQSA